MAEFLVVVVVLVVGALVVVFLFGNEKGLERDLVRARERMRARRAALTPRRPDTSLEDALSGLFTVAVTVALTAAAIEVLKKGFLFLKDLDWESLPPDVQKVVNRFGAELGMFRDNEARLERAKSLLTAGDRLSVELAAMLTSATLESGLKTLCARHRIELDPEQTDGMVGVAMALENRQVITSGDLAEIKRFAFTVRNKVMHGEFDGVVEQRVREQVAFTERLMQRQQPTPWARHAELT